MADLDLAVFYLHPLKKLFYNFLAAIILITIVSFVMMAVPDKMSSYNILEKLNGWILFAMLFGISFFYNRRNKADLKRIIETEDLRTKYDGYQEFYKKKACVECYFRFHIRIIFCYHHEKYLFLCTYVPGDFILCSLSEKSSDCQGAEKRRYCFRIITSSEVHTYQKKYAADYIRIHSRLVSILR